jgi:hypothetical protein
MAEQTIRFQAEAPKKTPTDGDKFFLSQKTLCGGLKQSPIP